MFTTRLIARIIVYIKLRKQMPYYLAIKRKDQLLELGPKIAPDNPEHDFEHKSILNKINILAAKIKKLCEVEDCYHIHVSP